LPEALVSKAIIYLGRSGGGLDLFMNISKQLQNRNSKYALFYSRNANILKFENISSTKIWTPEVRVRTLLRFYQLAYDLHNVSRITKKESFTEVIFVMLSPLDLFFYLYFKAKRIKITTIVHDSKTHLGEIFPPTFLIKFVCIMSNKIIFLSNYVKKQLMETTDIADKELCVSYLPIPVSLPPLKKNYDLLIIGRLKKYKGIEMFLESIKILGNPHIRILIAGKGAALYSSHQQVEVLDKWLTNNEIFSFLQTSRYLVLPYLEASQSGLIPMSIACRTPIIATPAGAIPEMLHYYQNGLLAKSADPKDFAEAIELALSKSMRVTRKRLSQNFYSDVLGGSLEN